MRKEQIAVLGDGSWGTTLAILLAKKGYPVTLWGAFPDYIEYLRRRRINTKFLPGEKIPGSIYLTAKLKEAVASSQIIMLAVPSRYLRKVVRRLKKEDYSGSAFLSLAKGIENNTLMRMSEVIEEELGPVKVAVLSGPTIAVEVSRGIPTTAVVASKDALLAQRLQDLLTTDRFRVYTNSDVIGVELGGSLKNIIAIACGISDGLGFGTNAKAALLSRGLAEIRRLGVAMGACPETFSGLSGLGDLVTTCISPFSRNRFVGEQIGKGKKLIQVLKKMEMVAEGVFTTKAASRLAAKFNVEMPITKEVYLVLYRGKHPLKAVDELMARQRKREY
jgi:glycerol-3-phosphate dehydrogenase (NAD(P)+)